MARDSSSSIFPAARAMATGRRGTSRGGPCPRRGPPAGRRLPSDRPDRVRMGVALHEPIVVVGERGAERRCIRSRTQADVAAPLRRQPHRRRCRSGPIDRFVCLALPRMPTSARVDTGSRLRQFHARHRRERRFWRSAAPPRSAHRFACSSTPSDRGGIGVVRYFGSASTGGQRRVRVGLTCRRRRPPPMVADAACTLPLPARRSPTTAPPIQRSAKTPSSMPVAWPISMR